jgi:N-acetylglucosamine kinase-like BadF-type ATPase
MGSRHDSDACLPSYNHAVMRDPSSRTGRDRSGRGLLVGADVGGTRARILAMHPDGRRLRAQGPAGATRDPAEPLARLWRRLRLRRDDVDVLVVAARGVWTAAERARAERRLAGFARRVRAISDVEAAFRGALGDAPGVLVLAGTGSIALGRDARGRWARAGGLGPLVGDGGSAFWIGRRWIAAGDPAKARRLATTPDAVARIAARAPLVLRRAARGDRRARAIVRGAQAELAALGVGLARRLRLPRPIAMTWAGRLMEDPRFRAGVWRAMRNDRVAIAPRAPGETPVAAALRLAQAVAVTPAPARGPRPSTSRPRGR